VEGGVRLQSDEGRAVGRIAPSILWILALIFPLITFAEPTPAVAQQATCPVAPQPDWTKGETLTWDRICRNLTAALDFEFSDSYAATADVDKWNQERNLSASFLLRILSDPVYVAAIPFAGVRIGGAHFPDDVFLADLEFDKPLQIFNSVFSGSIDMQGYRTRSWVSLYGNWFANRPPEGAADTASNLALDMTGADIGKFLVLSLSVSDGDVDLVDVRVGENFWINDATFRSSLWLDRVRIGGMLSANKLRVGIDLTLDGAEVEKDVTISDLEISRTMPDGSTQLGRLLAGQMAIHGTFQLGASDYQIGMPQALGVIAAPVAAPAAAAPSPGEDQADADAAAASSLPDTAAASSLTPGQLDLKLQELATTGTAETAPDRPVSVKAHRIVLNGSRVEGEMRLNRVSAPDAITMEDAVIGDDLWLTECDAGYVGLSAASVNGFVLLQQSRISNSLLLDSGSVGRSIVMDGGTRITGGFAVPGSTIKGSIYFTRSIIDGPTNLNSVTVERDVILGGEFTGPVDAGFARIGGSLDLTGGTFASVDLTGARIEAELRLAAAGAIPSFAEGAELSLRNVSTNALRDVADAWPQVLRLEGFSYQRQLATDDNSGAERRNPNRAKELVGWLAKQEPFSPQPYAYLADVLRQSGDNETAKTILFAGKMREWAENAHGWSKFWLSLQFLFTGFGVHPQVAGLWVLVLIAVGSWAFSRDPAPELNKLTWTQRLIYSADMLLPVVHLRHYHYDIDLLGWPRYYLYFHKIMGYVLLTFLAAALIGGGGFE
jgi:hypothetical protein